MNTTWTSAVGWARRAAGAAEVDDAASVGLAEQMKRAAADATAPADGVTSQRGDPAERSTDDQVQALFDAAYMMAAVGSEGVVERRARIAAALGVLFGGRIDGASVEARLESARRYIQEHGAVALSDQLAKTVTDAEGRAAILTLASTFAVVG